MREGGARRACEPYLPCLAAPVPQPGLELSRRGRYRVLVAAPSRSGQRRSGLAANCRGTCATGLCAQPVAAVLARPQSVGDLDVRLHLPPRLGPPTMYHALVLLEGGISGNLAGVGLVRGCIWLLQQPTYYRMDQSRGISQPSRLEPLPGVSRRTRPPPAHPGPRFLVGAVCM